MSFVRAAARWGCCTAAVASLALPAYSADKKTKEVVAETPSYYGPQPATENIDLTMYARIREEGLKHSHVMEFWWRSSRRHWATTDRLAEHGKGQRMDARHPHEDRLGERSPRRLGRVRHGLAADQHLGPNGLTRSRTPLGAGFPMVARNQRPSLRRSRLHECSGDGRPRKVQGHAEGQDHSLRRHAHHARHHQAPLHPATPTPS